MIAGTALIGGWILGQDSLKNLIPGTVDMKALTTIGLLFAALAVFVALLRRTAHRTWLIWAFAAVPLLLGAAVLSEYLLGLNLGIDELLFRDVRGRELGIAHPGRFAPTTAGSLVLLGAALFVLDAPPGRGWRPAELLMIPVAIVAGLSIIGYLYSIPAFYGPASATKMALNTALCLVALSGAILLARPRGRLVRLIVTDDPGGILMRRLIPLAVVFPLLLGYLHLQATKQDVLSVRVSTWWLSALTIGGFVLLITRVAHRLSANAAERRELEAELVHLANEDSLTGLWNRRRFDEEVAMQVERCRRYDEHAALLIVDLDHFKQVNDSYGHKVGDDLIRHVAETLQDRLRATDSLARLSGDEFGILLPLVTPDQAAGTAALLADWLRDKPFIVDEETLPLTGSVGVAFLDRSVADVDQVMVAADTAMYDAKAHGRDRISGLRRSSEPQGRQIRVYHCDDSEPYRRLLSEMLRAHQDIHVVGGCGDHDEALDAVAVTRPDVIVLDTSMEDHGSHFAAQLLVRSRGSHILVLSSLEACPAALAGKTHNFVAKSRTFDDIASAVRATAAHSAAA